MAVEDVGLMKTFLIELQKESFAGWVSGFLVTKGLAGFGATLGTVGFAMFTVGLTGLGATLRRAQMERIENPFLGAFLMTPPFFFFLPIKLMKILFLLFLFF